jgi:hypothetical protein
MSEATFYYIIERAHSYVKKLFEFIYRNFLLLQNERFADVSSLELEVLYDKLKYLVMPTFYGDRDRWIDMMKKSIGKGAYYFNSHRMMRRYVTEAYL